MTVPAKMRLLRYFQLGVLTAIAIAINHYLVAPLIGHLLGGVQLSAYEWIGFGAALLALVLLLIHRLGGFRGRVDVFSIRSFKNPPIWIIGVVGACLVIILDSKLSVNSKDVFFSLVLLLSIASLGWLIAFAWLQIGALPTVWSHAQNESLEENNNGAIERSEAPFGPIDIREDRYGHLRQAMIIVFRLLSSERGVNIRLIGEFGSGKTFICGMVQHLIGTPGEIVDNLAEGHRRGIFNSLELLQRRSRNFIFITVRSWGLDSDDPIDYLLRSIVGQLGLHLDCTGILDVPPSYRRMLTSASGGFAGMVDFGFDTAYSPEDVLARIDKVCMRSGVQLVVILEDLDRNPIGDKLHSQLCALLDRFGKLPNVSFILCAGSAFTGYGHTDRAFDFEVSIPVISESAIGQIREHYIAWESLIPEAMRVNGLGPSGILGIRDASVSFTEDRRQRLAMGSSEMKSPLTEIVKIASSPRRLNHLIQMMEEAWPGLAGEVDLDEFFVLVAIQSTCPRVYDKLIENAEELRMFQMKQESSSPKRRVGTKDDLSRAIAKLKTEVSELSKLYGVESDSILFLVEAIFPNLGEKSTNVSGVQALRNYRPNDYFERAVNRITVVNSLSDREVVEEILDWKSHRDNSFVNRIAISGDLSDKVEYFQHLFSPSDILELTSQLFRQIVENRGRLANEGWGRFEFIGITSLWRMALRNPVEASEHENWVLGEIEKYASISLHLTNTIFYFWRSRESSEVTSRMRNDRIAEGYLDSALRAYTPSGVITTALKSPLPSDIDLYFYQISHLFRESCEAKPSLDHALHPSNWLQDIVFREAQENPNQILPQVAMLASHVTHDLLSSGGWLKISDDFLNVYCPKRSAELLAMVKAQLDTSSLPNDVRLRCEELKRII